MRARRTKTKLPIPGGTKKTRPPVTTYDSDYDHSLEHWIELQELVEEEDYERPAARSQAG